MEEKKGGEGEESCLSWGGGKNEKDRNRWSFKEKQH
jgi:hypothetical protein